MSVSVSTPCGEIIGIQCDGYQEFRGIPYAEQPIGVARFKAPEPLLPFEEPFKAERFGDAAPQENIPFFGIEQTSEDCLYLNIWSPACDNKKRPVMVWIHGGGFVTGASSQVIYKGRELAVNGDVVVVTLNYRLGALGFLYLNDLLPDEYEVSANNGLLDQIEALKWIKKNIESFGGNPNQITLFGESAGAWSIATLLASPLATGLFQRAILQSGGADQVLTHSEATEITRRFLKAADIDATKPEKLWQLSTSQIIKAQQACFKHEINRGAFGQPVMQTGITLLPVIDGVSVSQQPLSAIRNGDVGHIPLMVGCTRDEWNLFLNMPGVNRVANTDNAEDMGKLDLINRCETSLPGMGERAANLYQKRFQQNNTDVSYSDIFSAFESDRMFRIPSLRIAEQQSKHSEQIFMFQFNWDKGPLKACHASDIPFVFGHTGTTAGQFLTGGGDDAAKLSATVQSCWIAFARSGDPSTDRVGKWTAFNQDSRQVMCFDTKTGLQEDPFQGTAPLWENVL
ncbi:carboxylesterase/lipase family protein [Ketobacter sp.]|nr:MAG: carboxylesterase/lipase family protein [Ketobacter sp.]